MTREDTCWKFARWIATRPADNLPQPCSSCGEAKRVRAFLSHGYACVACPCGRELGIRGTIEEAIAYWNAGQ